MYFGPTKLFSNLYPAQFLDILAKSFLLCRKMYCLFRFFSSFLKYVLGNATLMVSQINYHPRAISYIFQS